MWYSKARIDPLSIIMYMESAEAISDQFAVSGIWSSSCMLPCIIASHQLGT